MKKVILSSLLIGSCLMLASCGTTTEDAAIKNLANQVDKLNNVVANSSVIDTNAIDLTNYTKEEEDTSAIRNIYQKTKTSIDTQNEYKNKILTKTASIKNSLASNDLKIGNKNLNAIRELSNTLSKYTTKLANTNNEYKKTANSVAKLKNNSGATNSMLGAKLTRLSSCADSRSCYYNNLLNTLAQIELLLNSGVNVQDNVLNNNNLSQADYNNINDTNLNNNCENGVCYDENGNIMNGSYCDDNGNCVNGNTEPSRAYVNNAGQTYNAPTPNQNGYNNNNLYRNRYPQNGGVNNYYNNRYNGGFNPDRNTDTYAPNISNIDTYRNNYGYGNYANLTQTEEVSTSENNDEVENDTKDIKENPNTENKIMTLEEKTENKVADETKDVETKKEETKPLENNITNDATNNKPAETKITTINMNEDGKDDKNPRTENLRFSKQTSQTQKLTSRPSAKETTAISSKDYKSSNKKIKELIQSSAPANDINENFFNVV